MTDNLLFSHQIALVCHPTLVLPLILKEIYWNGTDLSSSRSPFCTSMSGFCFALSNSLNLPHVYHNKHESQNFSAQNTQVHIFYTTLFLETTNVTKYESQIRRYVSLKNLKKVFMTLQWTHDSITYKGSWLTRQKRIFSVLKMFSWYNHSRH